MEREDTRPERPSVPKLTASEPAGKPENVPTSTRLDFTGPLPLARSKKEPPSGGELRTCPACQAAVPLDLSYCPSCGEALAPDPLLGKIVDERYEVVQRLGAGAMGAVYEVRHLRLGKRFAMKVIHRELSQVPEFVARFEREALSTSRLHHPNCILVTDFGHAASGELYLVMEFLEGQALSTLLDKPIPIGAALEITRQVLLGVQHAHEAGVIHRDLKPDNVVRIEKSDGSWEIKVVDFGIAKLPLGSSGSDKEPLTKAGVVFGTPQYMAPEQALGGEIGPQTDIYAIGAMLWRMITGRHVFEAEGHMEVLSAKLASSPPPLDKVAPGVFSRSVQELLRRCLQRNPSERMTTTKEVLAVIDEIRAEPGGGLASGGAGSAGGLAGVARRAITVAGTGGRTVATLVGSWYRCEGTPGPPSWSSRAQTLVTTSRGGVVLAILVGALALLVVVPVVALSDDEASNPVQPVAGQGSEIRARPTKARSGRGSTRAQKKLLAATRSPVPTGRTPLDRAQMFLSQGACREAELEAQRALSEDPNNGRARYFLGAALYCDRSYREALSAYAGAIAVDGSIKNEAQLLADLERLLRIEKQRELAFSFLEQKIGPPSLPLLLRLASNGAKPAIRHRAAEIVARFGAADRIDRLNSLSLDLKQLRSCKERAGVVEELRQLKDVQAIPILRAARDERAGWWFGTRYKHWCIRKQLAQAITELSTLPGGDAYR